MKSILTRLFTVLMLMMFSMGASADVKVIYGDNGTEKFEGSGGSIKIEQADSKSDKTKVKVYLTFIPDIDKGYTFDEKSLEVYAVISPEPASTRGPEISGDPLKLTEEKTDISSAKRYSVDIDSKLALWVKKATFTNSEEAKNRSDYSGTYFIKSESANKKTAGDYYLCPTEGWIYYTGTNSFTETDNGQPFLTTYQCKSTEGYINKAIWKIGKNGNYYTIRHVIDGKYMVYNGQISNANVGRIRVHLADVVTPGDNELFVIGTNTAGKIVISPKNESANYFNVCQGNINSLAGSTEWNVKAKNDGPTTPTNHKTDIHGTIGLYSGIDDSNAPFSLEDASSYVCETPTITYNESSGEVSLYTTTDGATIYYTLDGSKPTSSSTAYTAPFTVSSSVVVQAIAFKADKCNSLIASKQLVKYVYNIINRSGNIAIQYAIPHPVSPGTALSGYASIPEAIRSSYINDETVNFYSFSGTYNVGDAVNETTISTADPITATPTTGTNIYITYSTDHLGSKFLHLQGSRPLNIKREDGETYKYLYDNNGTLALDASTEASITTNSHLWYIKGVTTPDPYDVIIQNSAKTLYLTNSSSTLSLNAAASTYILFDSSPVDTDHEYITLKRLSDGSTFSIRVNPVVIPTSYYLIDKAGKIIFGPKESTSSAKAVPSEWESPLVSQYHYWKIDAFDEEKRNAGDPVYELIKDPAPAEIESLTDLAAGEHIYVTYDVDPSFVFDTTDDDAVGSQAYRLRFTGGETFRQENGKDVLMDADKAQKAVYPYSNGDAMLYVYGTEQWNTQLSSGASTRTRWLWYVVSPNGDPYHVYIMSHQGQASSHNYFRTYAVEYGGSSHIVTGVTTKNSAAASEEPTEYMILKQGSNCKLVTTISGVQHIVNSFEQYWKNNPTIQNMLATKVTDTETYSDDITLNSTQLGQLETKLTTDLYNKWHSYKAFANAAPWVGWKTDNTGSGKQYKQKTHWFQTIDMGSTGEFIFEATTLQPQVILVDNHGWEVVRMPMYTDSKMTVINTAALKKYDSPMVETYHWYPTSKKTDGYHKYTVSDPQIVVYSSYLDGSKTKWKDSGNRTTHTSTTLTDIPYDHFVEKGYEAQDASVKTDFYVTYTVKPDYADTYAGAAVEENTQASKYLVKQGDSYAKISDSNTIATESTRPDINSVAEELQWYVKPNFDIDKEMGYQYDVVKVDTRDDNGNVTASHVADEAETNADYVTAGKHGFDPYNVQIESVKNTDRYFKTNTTDLTLVNGAWTGTTTALSLQRLDYNKQSASGYDQTALSITNATFMVVDDGNGNMRLMPRFDNSKVVDALTGTQITSLADATHHLTLELVPTTVSKSSDIKSMGGYYKLSSNFYIDESVGTSSSPFMGTIDGQLTPITGAWNAPLIAYAEDATIKNIIINSVSIDESTPDTNVGAIVSNALGETRIYNCGILGGSVSGTKYVGGLVGLLDYKQETNKGSRVINCFSYADVSGGTDVGGIVGYNSFSSRADDIRTMVMNCMFYGDITKGTNKSPVYGGNAIDNAKDHSNNGNGLNNYNYYRYESNFSKNNQITTGKYNCALAAEEKYLIHFEFYRLLLNSNKKLAAFYASKTDATVNPDDIAKWVLESADRTNSTPNPYPVLKSQGKYPSMINYDDDNVPTLSLVDGKPSEEDRNKGGKFGTLKVSIEDNTSGKGSRTGSFITTSSKSLAITDKDFEKYNYNYYKVRLPYYNEVGTGNYTKNSGESNNRVVTGWIVTSMTGATPTQATSGEDVTITDGVVTAKPYNFADRTCTKDENGDYRVFSQGAYFDVPFGVTAITIKPYWANAAFISDKYLDRTYKSDFTTGTDVTGEQYTDNNTYTINDISMTVRNSFSNALSDITTKGSTVYDNAIVLVGNFHQDGVPYATKNVPFTVMSADFDNDNEPDYSLIYHHIDRKEVSPIRFDFINIPSTSMAQKPNGSSKMSGIGIFKPYGWFEVTNTTLISFGQIEYDFNAKSSAPLILLGGEVLQIVSNNSNKDGTANSTNHTKYFHIGCNVWFKEFNNGIHSDKHLGTPHRPISVTGGRYEKFYLSGIYQPTITSYFISDDAECYISGGSFGEVAGAGQEKIDGNVNWFIDYADIDNFYGGGINATNAITGDIYVDIKNSHVDVYCGGPKFGNMGGVSTPNDANDDKKVTTNAEGCVFRRFFGAGYGGASYNRVIEKTAENNQPWSTWDDEYTNRRGKYLTDRKGIATGFEYEYFIGSKGTIWGRFYVNYASFSKAIANNVYSNLTGCHITGDFYGGGSLGVVNGTAYSSLDGCTVDGSVFGGGYSGSIPNIDVVSSGFSTNPGYNSTAGIFTPAVISDSAPYKWTTHTVTNDKTALGTDDEGADVIYTIEDLANLGQVGNVDLTIKGNTYVKGDIHTYDVEGKVETSKTITEAGGVFGGGDASSVKGNVNVKIEGTSTEGSNVGVTNVYGGGNTADVEGNSEVEMTSGIVGHDIYGGGKGQTTVVGGDVKVNIGTKAGNAPSYTYTGTGIVKGDVYGGSAMGAVNTTPNESSIYDKTTAVNIYSGTVNGSVFGGGLGEKTESSNIAAQNFGNTTVNMEGGTVKAVYGGSNANGVLKNNSTVTITGGTVGTAPGEGQDIANVVFGGGFGEPTLVEGDVEVNIGTKSDDQTPVYTGNATINGHVYGGGALGNVNTSKPESTLVFDATKTTAVNLYKGTINGDAYGGGLGNAETAAYVGGDVNVLLDGAKITGSIFGCNNINGTPKGHVKVWVKRTVGNDKPTLDNENNKIDRDHRPVANTTYDVAAVYGGGNRADYVPSDATLDASVAGNPAKIAAACAEVIIEGCDETSIEYVYGGGNAAAVPATDVTIKGSYIIHQVFGGGNGAGAGNPGANVGVYDHNNPKNYGSGKAVTKLYAGKIHQVFGGSNTLGNVRGGTSVTMPKLPDGYTSPEYCGTLDVKDIFGAGQNAEQDGGVTMILGCVWNMKNVYGGAMNANVKGGVDLVITSGTFENVFGGNDTSGTIQGPITVTVEETGCDPVVIGNLYLGGNKAAYSVYGYKEDGGKLVARTSLTDGMAVNPPTTNYSETQLYRDPILNVVSCTSIGNVFGGGFGSGAIMYGSPTVNINMVPGFFADQIDRDNNNEDDNNNYAIGEIGNVYGGGSAADVIGDTHVNICTESTIKVRTQMGAEIPEADRKPKTVLPAYITGDVFGAGKGDKNHVEYAKVTGNTTIVMGGGEVKKSIYGGGELSQVTGNTNITVNGGTIGTMNEGGEEYGNIYGGGKGNTTNVKAGLILGNTNISISEIAADEAYIQAHEGTTVKVGDILSTPHILHNIYGGGAHGSVGTFTYDGSDVINGYTSGGVANINITGGTIGTDGHNNGMVFGSSRGDVDKPGTIYDKVAWIYDANVIIGTEGKGETTTTPSIKGSVYGSGENGHTYHNASVTIHSGMVGITEKMSTDPEGQGGAKYPYRGNVYGGGCGTDKYYSSGTETHDGNGDKFNPNAGIVKGITTVLIDGGHVVRDVYGAGSMGSVDGSTSVTIAGKAIIGAEGSGGGYVYAAARGDLSDHTMATVSSSTLNISGGTVWGDAYGGGQAGYVKGAVTVNLTGGEVKQDVYGGGALAQTNTEYDANDNTKKDYVTTVNLGNSTSGTTIGGDLYGGGLGRVGENPVAANVNGPVTVTVTKGLATNVFGCNNVNGAPQKTVTVNINGTNDPTASITLPIHNVYGGGNQAAYTYTDAANPQNLKVNIAGGTIGNVFGGGLSADVAGGIDVKVSGGTVVDDVYGGGALANTNTGNWSVANSTWSDTSTGTYYAEVKHLKRDTPASGETQASQGDDVSSYYKRTGGSGTSVDPYIYESASGTAQQNITYYKKLDNVLKVAANGTTYKTIVSLTGGTIGNAYGGGLGQLYKAASGTPNTEGYQPETPAVEAMVYGDVEIIVGDGTGTAAFTNDVEYISGGSENVAKHGRVFGCNNLNGTPKGKVTVTINSTKRTDGSNNHVKGEFEIQGVYGGGNLSHYVPSWYDNDTEFGQHTKVIVDGCSNTSINKVYGGGNAANVPFTDVEINGAFEIGYVFGGGNGGDKINKGAGWEANPGASVTHYANVMLRGGTIGQAFGGSDTKGTVGGADVKQETSADCPLRIVNLYGAGNGEDANSEGDINIEVSACGEGSEIQNVFGGSYKANIKGSVTLTIKSGIFTSVYGGNDRLGSIGGNITVNIEETDNCSKPIIIQNLYGGCYQTAYPGPDAKTWNRDTPATYTPFTSGKITVNVRSATRIDRIYGGSENGAVTGDTEVNINMVRGSQSGQTDVALPSYYGETGAVIPGNIVNVTKGGYVEVHGLVTNTDVAADPSKTQSSVVGYYTRSGSEGSYTYTAATGLAQAGVTYYKQSVKGDIKEGIGTIGEVFGGGNRGNVSGNATVNISTEPTVTLVSHSNAEETVLGAHITGNVYGGGNLADVKGNTVVNICAKYSDTNSRYEAIAEGTEKVTIGGIIYGGGKGADDNFFCDKGMVGENNTNDGKYENADKGTHIHIGNGTIGTLVNGALKAGTGNVYGGGEVGRVEFHSVVEVGLTPQTNSVTSAPEILGSVFGGGKGVETHGYAALLRGHTSVTVQQNAKVRNSVYGGGEIATIGRFWIKNVNNKENGAVIEAAKPVPEDLPDGMPYKLRDGGKCTVSILGNAEVGPSTIMAMPQFTGNVFGAGKGFLPKVYDYTADNDAHRPKRVSPSGDDYFEDEAAYMVFVETQALVDNTDVTIGGNAFVKGSVYGGSENGRVLNDTYVKIAGGQIGWGKNAGGRHAASVWENPSETDYKCPSWNFESPYAPYDPFAINVNGTYKYDYSTTYSVIKPEDQRENSDGGMPTGSDGHTYYGNVFGGGCGKDPFAPGKWHRQAGFVGGDTHVTITGGHILTNVYGGNEHTDVGTYGTDGLTHVSGGECTIQMSGGTIGVPRTPEQIVAHPGSGYLFGAGKGDQRIFFNTWTNVQNTNVEVSGTAVIYGSVLGGGEDGHVLTDTKVEIKGGTIGTTGTSSFDGNVFGGGRGLSGEALTAGSVGGNVDLDITGGNIKGNVYGGGRLASVGIDFTPATDPSYGQLVDDKPNDSPAKTYGHISIDISGGTIGTTTASDDTHPVGGNVYGGSMGRITLLDGSLNPLWPKQAVVKLTNVTISGGEIKNNVYGGSEYGIVRNQATVNMTGGNVYGNVFGGGYGSDKQNQTTITAGGYTSENPTLYYTFTPMLWTGCVSGNTFVNISGGTVAKNVYGGGDMASVGLINFNSSKDGETYTFNYITKHDDSANGFALSWPYKFEYIKAAPNDDAAIGGNAINGKATVSITGGTIGTKTNDKYADNTGFVFGGSKGKVWFGATKETVQDITTQRYTEAFMANVLKTEVTIGGGTMRTVYGGGEDGHVYEDTKVTINNGSIENSVFGGGKGEGIFKTTLWQQDSAKPDDLTAHVDLTDQNVHSWTAGKVYGNTEVIMNGGSVGMFIYGGGNLGSVGKGNYAGGSDDYSTSGYGELPNNSVNSGKLWTTSSTAESETKDDAYHFLNSGVSTVTIMGGTVGPTTGTGTDDDGIPYGSVFGGSRGKAAKDVGARSPRYRYVPDFFLGYVNKAVVNIGGTSASAPSSNSPTIYGSVYGGGQDGHVRNSTEVRIFKGTIQGQSDEAERSGHVFGAGSGIGKYETTVNNETVKVCSNSSGSVTCTTLVEVNGGTIHGNVYGGGAMATVGPPQTGQGFDEYNNTTTNYTTGSRAHGSKSYTQVDIKGGTIGGDVYGASRGPSDTFRKQQFTDKGITYDETKFATDLWSDVNISGGTIAGSVFGGGETGYVKCGVTVDVTGGNISTDVYGGGARANTNTSNWVKNKTTNEYEWADNNQTSGLYTTAVNLQGGVIDGDAYGGGLGRLAGTDIDAVDATVYGNVTVRLNQEKTTSDKGCVVNRIFGANNLNGSPKGTVRVYVYATQNATEETIGAKKANAISGLRIVNQKTDLLYWLQTIAGVDPEYATDPEDAKLKTAKDVYNNSASTNADYKAQVDILSAIYYKQALNYWIGKSPVGDLKTAAQTVYNNGSSTKAQIEEQTSILKAALRQDLYDVQAVYGGGNLSAYEPINDLRSEVHVQGCEETSIKYVYGGGNAASVPATYVGISEAYEIEEVFGGGNGKDNIIVNGVLKQNPGAHVGYHDFTVYSTETDASGALKASYDSRYDNKDKRLAATDLHYGSGVATTVITGGVIHRAYGGSNTKGIVRAKANSSYEELSVSCPMHVDEAYGAGKEAELDAEIEVDMSCASGVEVMYGGAKDADLGNVTVNVTNGSSLKNVFGGNNTSGHINGSITVNVKESGCEPIVISEGLYGGGYLAPYSIYGYKENGDPRTKADFDLLTTEQKTSEGLPYADPRINIISATRIANIYGGGYQALVVGNPHVNVNMEQGMIAEKYVNETSHSIGDHTTPLGDEYSVTGYLAGNAILGVGSIGNIYGGGNEADVIGDTYVEIGTGEWINADGVREMDGTIKVNNEDLTTTFTYNTTSKKWTYKKTTGETTETIEITGTPTPARNVATITGNVFGGGKGKADTFECEKAMIGKENSGEGSTNVTIVNGTVEGNVYGGGMVGRVEANTTVTIGLEGNKTNEIVIDGDVYGAGQGVATHGYSGLTRGHSTVTVQGKSKVRGSVYGGGQKATVGRFYVKGVNDTNYEHRNDEKYKNVPKGMPYALISGGKCTVIIQDDAEIGPDDMVMTANEGPDDAGHVFGAGKGITPYVDTDTESGTGDGKGPGRWYNDDNNHYTWQSYAGDANETKYLKYIETLALAHETDVTIKDNAFVKGSVYGGSENGRVLDDTHVTIDGDCQIGNGYVQMADNGTYLTNPLSMNRRYTDTEWTQGKLIMGDNDRDELKTLVGSNYSSSLPECASWKYESPYAVHDKFAGTGNYDSKGGAVTATDGHTFYGNVFGGGSGYYPYAAGKWHRAAGAVGGNTVVDITGGHILTSVYGGNEMTDVGNYVKDGNNDNEPLIPVAGTGKCTINMTGGTLGVPRTLGQIAAHPVTCYMYGAGKGDPRIFFNTWTNISNAEINVSGNARIYGSIFGGGEDGHVIYDVVNNIDGSALIGTTGTSYVDGNVFGAGRGFSGHAITAGSVGGNVEVNIKGGTMLGSIYGGGRLASVGIGFNAPSNANYGSFTEDGPVKYTQAEITAAQAGDPAYGKTTNDNKIDDRTYGHITVNISGGTIGNDFEFKEYEFEIETNGLTRTQIEAAKATGLMTKKIEDKIPYTDFELYDSVLVANSTTKYKYTYRTAHTKGGNVFGGSMGRLKGLNDVDYLSLWPQLGQVKSTTVNISGNSTIIKSNVYGGGELGTVRDNATIVVGKKSKTDTEATTKPTINRDIFGGGYGSNISNVTGTVDAVDNDSHKHTYLYTPMKWAGCVGIGSEVNIYDGWVMKNVYGGGEMASVGIINYEVKRNNSDEPTDEYKFITQHTNEASSFALSWPYQFEYVNGYIGTAKINITGGRLGCTKDNDIGTDNGDVYGGGKGIAGDFKDYMFCANVGSAEVNINYTSSATTLNPATYMDGGDCIAGAVYGGAENGHVMGDTKVTLTNGLIGHALYGGGSGKSKFSTRLLKIGATKGENDNYAETDYYTRDIYSITAGKVFGNTNVEMTGGYVVRNIFGGGTMGSVGKGNYAGGTDDYSYIYANDKQYNGYGEAINGPLWTSSSEGDNAWHFLNSGKCTVKITGGTVGYVASDPSKSMKDGLPYGNVFGGCRGEAAPNITESPRYLYCPEFFVGYANETEVIIGDGTKIDDTSYKGPTILGSVYGGGQDGHVRRDAHVIINKGEIGLAFNNSNRAVFNTTGKTLSQELDDPQWLYRGNVFGAGSGISKYQYDFNYDNKIDDTVAGITYHGNAIKEEDYSTSAGSVTRFTTVEVKGGSVHRNVYGGGSLASVGPPAIPPTRTDLADKKDDTTHGPGWQSQCTVNIAGKIGTPDEYQAHYGGEVYGASRGLSAEIPLGSVVWTQVNVKDGANIQGNVFGGGDAGMVKRDAEVIIGDPKE